MTVSEEMVAIPWCSPMPGTEMMVIVIQQKRRLTNKGTYFGTRRPLKPRSHRPDHSGTAIPISSLSASDRKEKIVEGMTCRTAARDVPDFRAQTNKTKQNQTKPKKNPIKGHTFWTITTQSRRMATNATTILHSKKEFRRWPWHPDFSIVTFDQLSLSSIFDFLFSYNRARCDRSPAFPIALRRFQVCRNRSVPSPAVAVAFASASLTLVFTYWPTSVARALSQWQCGAQSARNSQQPLTDRPTAPAAACCCTENRPTSLQYSKTSLYVMIIIMIIIFFVIVECHD